MANYTGSSGVVKFVTSGGTVATVASVRSYTVSQTVDSIDTTTLGATGNWRSNTAALKSFTVSVECFWDDDDAAQADMIAIADTVDFEIYPEGDSAGTRDYFSGSCIVTQADVTASVDGMVEFSFSGTGTGALTLNDDATITAP